MNIEKLNRRTADRRSYEEQQQLRARRGKRNKTIRGNKEYL